MRAPVLAFGDGALWLPKAMREGFSDPREQRCWWHWMAKVFAAVPQSEHPSAKAAMAEVHDAEDNQHPWPW